MIPAEAERAAMSREILHQIDDDEIDKVLSELDSETHEFQANGLLVMGPFALFWANTALPEASVNHELPSEPSASMDFLYVAGDHDDISLTPTVDMDCTSSFGQIPGPFSLFAPCWSTYPDIHIDADPNYNISERLVAVNLPPMNNSQIALPSPLSFHVSLNIENDLEAPVSPTTHFLLRHYRAQAGKLFSPRRVHKSPWDIMHLPRVLSIFSELSVFNKSTHAETALFYGTLAVSAFNFDRLGLEQDGSSDYWWVFGERLRHKAKVELGRSFDTEISGGGKSKYKDILMAILTMVTISVVNGQQAEARSFLLNADMFICLRGIPKVNKSRKVKLLHQIYLFLRIIEESTYVFPQETQQRLSFSLPHNKMKFPSLRTHSLHVGRDLDEHCGGDLELGLFGAPGDEDCQQNSTLFGQIYGIPETLLSFISRISSLADEIGNLNNQSKGLTMTDELERRCRNLENEICSWSSDRDSVGDNIDDPISMSANRAFIPHLVVALHSAVIIFFYRRVRKLNSFLLQSYAEKAIVAIERAEKVKLGFSVVNTGIVWPVFIAAAETMNPDLQLRSSKLLRDCAKTSGLRNFDVAEGLLQDLWKRRRGDGNAEISWVDLVIERKLTLVLT
ncbi:fungal-specific transcription factor domain-containing protein [Penicillium cosmopolitanum]|uniref:Fungal-specific transcription factor domain-containing protein n=1 Tax=Penicillium cosmopolitanum TaxID=1131564 RepID=A0A9X0BE54_9EURO|nr:fungal-specific transcription factor domain-containing protein [Penicillium cosmopolitanum]KAJ5413718.1 fungal-specific transcription factor domain-containing protein [Penicillium cosmopolitanum]